MDLKVIKQVVELMKRSEISEFEIEEKDFKLRLSRKNGETQIVQAAPVATAPPVSAAPVAPAEVAKPSVEDPNVFVIKSPMVGTFYRASSPESQPFAKVGEKVGRDSIVCIIEAMKIMNPIESDRAGTVTAILVENGQPVEFEQPLFVVD